MNSLTRSNHWPSLIENFRIGSPIGPNVNDFFNTNTSALYHVPAVNVVEHEHGFRIEVAAPGLKKEDFKLSLNHNSLTISAYQETNEEKPNKTDEKFTRREFGYSSFQRTFTLPTSVNADAIQAAYANGVLNIELPKRAETKQKAARQVEIAG